MLSWVALWQVGFNGETTRIPVLRWVTSGELDVSWALRVDTLTAVMLVVVNTVSFLVHLYSIGYMPTTTAGRASSPISPCSPSPCWRW